METLETQYKNWQDANPQHSQVTFIEWKTNYHPLVRFPQQDTTFRNINTIHEVPKKPIPKESLIKRCKPIFVIRFPDDLSMDEFRAIQNSIKNNDVVKDYHILTLKDGQTGNETKFECYNAPHTEIEFQELQNKILKLMGNEK